MLTTGKTTTTRMLPVLANTTLTGRDVATAVERNEVSKTSSQIYGRFAPLLPLSLGTYGISFHQLPPAFARRLSRIFSPLF